MITVISGTNRPGSLTVAFSKIYFKMLQEKAADSNFFSLESLPDEILHTDVYDKARKPEAILKMQNEVFAVSDKFVIIFPEYNGTYPGILKLMIDVMDPKIAFAGKKVALIGVSTGRAGNLRGIDQLTAVMHHVDAHVMPKPFPLSRIQHEMENDSFKEETYKLIQVQIARFIAF